MSRKDLENRFRNDVFLLIFNGVTLSCYSVERVDI